MAVLQSCRQLELAIEFRSVLSERNRLLAVVAIGKPLGRPVHRLGIVCSDVQTEEACNDGYHDHDADDVEDIHCALRARRA
jgi:hypothetical protein